MAKGKKSRAATEAAAPSNQPHEQSLNICSHMQTEVTKASSQTFHAFISDLEASPSPIVVGKQPVEPALDKGSNADVEGAKPPYFAGLFSNNRKLSDDNKLQKFVLGEGMLKLETSDLIDVKAKLGFCLVGYIAGKFPGFKAIREMAHSWGATFQQHASGWLIFRFARDEDRQHTLAGGPYFIFGRPLFLKNMPDCFEFKEDDISLTPVWAILPALPLECWNPKALGKIGSAVGNPIAMDSLTFKMERVSYARILVEVDASKPLVDKIEFMFPNGVTRKQPVDYEVTPKFYSDCCKFGHLKDSCQGLQAPAAAPSAPSSQTVPEKQSKAHPSEWTTVKRRSKKAKKNQHQATESLPTEPNVDAAGECQIPQKTSNLIQKQQGPAKPKQAWTVTPQRIPSHQPEIVSPSPSDLSDSEDESSTATQHHMPGRESFKSVLKQYRMQEEIDFWNVRGFNRPLKHNGVAHLIKSNNLCLLGILETKLAASAIPCILHRSFPGWCQVNNFDLITGGRILVIWNSAIIDLQPEDISQQVIHYRITNKSSQLSFSISFTYGLYSIVNRRSMWEKLSELGQNLNSPWLILGDFNCVRSPEEKLGVTPTWYELKDFTDCCLSLGLQDATSTGCFFTWYSNNESNPVWCKLDRVLRNNEWLEAGLHCNTHFPPPGCLSDHSPGIVSILDPPVPKPKPFRFFNMNLKALKGPLKAFNKVHYGHISVRAKETDLALQDAQVQLESDPENSYLRDLVGELRKKAIFLAEAERQFYYQKAKIHFLKMGD
ncbi:hypothetical protein Salat_2637100 [Sesamum alatum]|uniref:DUF4283 domain-containing protein n=1 Tax=Sesamum alatum TaxID=300844 RepID=A0AAE1XNT0_9LAMI|nr:hypothetical protein Salat_2637100 [Sesamum alatum]